MTSTSAPGSKDTPRKDEPVKVAAKLIPNVELFTIVGVSGVPQVSLVPPYAMVVVAPVQLVGLA